METILAQVLWLTPACDMYAVDGDGNKIVPDPAARTGPETNVIFGVTSPDRFLYHYTSLDTAQKILENFALLMGEFQGTNDPKESKEWHFDVLSRLSGDFKGTDTSKLSRDLSEVIKRHARVLCFCRDSSGLTGNHMQDVSLRGHFKARMWAQYGSSSKDSHLGNQKGLHSGVCLVFDREKIIDAIHRDIGNVGRLQYGEVTYRNRSVIAAQHEKDYFIDFDVFKSVGFDIYWRLHAQRFVRRLFFEKALDWRDETEFRALVLLEEKPRQVFVNVRDSLIGMFLGENCNLDVARPLISKLMDRGVHVMGVSWKNCTPWYDIANPIYNYSARALDEAVRRHDAENAGKIEGAAKSTCRSG